MSAETFHKARKLYEAYIKKVEELRPHQEYADCVSRATSGKGMTPVMPLATMGTGGGPLLCDHCGKAIILEGGNYNGVPADVAWERNPKRDAKWKSWIAGGVLFEVKDNGTIRVYHGYPQGSASYCCNAAAQAERKMQATFKPDPESMISNTELFAFLQKEFPDKSESEYYDMLSHISDLMYSYDPGIGVNRPT